MVGRKKERHAHDDVPDAFERAVSYVDTVEFLFKRALNKEAFKRFRLALLAATRPFGSKYVRKRVPSANGYFIVKIVLHRPTADSLRVLEEAERRREIRVLKVHVALDLIARSGFAMVEKLRGHIEARLIPSTRSEKRILFHGDTVYYNRGTKAGIETVLYSDRPSKMGFGEGPCCHLEYRVVGPKALERCGLATTGGIRQLDHRTFWDANLKFWRPPSPEALARAGNNASRARTSESLGTEKNQKAANQTIRLATSGHATIFNAYMLLWDLRRGKRTYNQRPLRLFERLSHAWALPPSRNYFWPLEEAGQQLTRVRLTS